MIRIGLEYEAIKLGIKKTILIFQFIQFLPNKTKIVPLINYINQIYLKSENNNKSNVDSSVFEEIEKEF